MTDVEKSARKDSDIKSSKKTEKSSKELRLDNLTRGKKKGQNRANIDGKSSTEISDFFMESGSESDTEDSSDEVVKIFILLFLKNNSYL